MPSRAMLATLQVSRGRRPTTRARRSEHLRPGAGSSSWRSSSGWTMLAAPRARCPAKESATTSSSTWQHPPRGHARVLLSAFFVDLRSSGPCERSCGSAEGAPGHLSAITFGARLVTITLATTASLRRSRLASDDTTVHAEPGLVPRVGTCRTLALVPIGSRRGRVLPRRGDVDPGGAA